MNLVLGTSLVAARRGMRASTAARHRPAARCGLKVRTGCETWLRGAGRVLVADAGHNSCKGGGYEVRAGCEE